MNVSAFSEKLGTWTDKLRGFIESEKCDEIYAWLKTKAREGRILPDSDKTFRAFQICPYKDVRVVIISQDPYPTLRNGIPCADGVAFSCSLTGVLQPSLEKFYEGMQDDVYKGTPILVDMPPDLGYLGGEGVLLLNSSLTVTVNRIGSHAGIWDPFMMYLIKEVFCYNPGLVYILIGREAERWESVIDINSSHILKCEHPSAAARAGRPWEHNRVFTKCNGLLRKMNGSEVCWDKPPFG